MKGTFAQAELHIIRARLHGGKLNKAQKGESIDTMIAWTWW
jgi:DNA invertase Pin-like site-specific DNA recombinase